MGTPGGLERGSRSRGVAALSSRGVHRRRGGSGGDQPPVATGSGEQRTDRGGGVGWQMEWAEAQMGGQGLFSLSPLCFSFLISFLFFQQLLHLLFRH